ncbi:3-deoxy-7-phosphoheptulonate synthase class II [Micromonospora sp. DT31]|uniref:3-deoxy-7-phosphoheptulonate synthase class II n=1 Tax=Micromonospora sp. DT31 TaxID=3393434 RepID=UPI003CE69F04
MKPPASPSGCSTLIRPLHHHILRISRHQLPLNRPEAVPTPYLHGMESMVMRSENAIGDEQPIREQLPELAPDLLRRLSAALRLPAGQQPSWPLPDRARAARELLSRMPPIVPPGETDELKRRLAAVAQGEAFLVQGGDCAETFSASAEHIQGNVKTLLAMSVVLTYAADMPVAIVGRMAGQYAKPRSRAVDILGLPAYRGDIVNSPVPTPAGRTPDPDRLLGAYADACRTRNLMRAASHTPGLGDIHEVNQDFVRTSPTGSRYAPLVQDIERALRFVAAWNTDHRDRLRTEVFTSHEALLLDYEVPLLRATGDGSLYASSGHLLWLGERTRQFDGAHLALAELLSNPVGVKIGPGTKPDDAIAYAERLNPEREPGRLVMITRMGRHRIREVLPPIVAAVTAAGHPVVWQCDPMHGNTHESPTGYKTRHFDDVLDEVRGFFEVHCRLGTHPGGIHVELTGDDVTECLGGPHQLTDADLSGRYETTCDPRLNARQSIELAFLLAELVRR